MPIHRLSTIQQHIKRLEASIEGVKQALDQRPAEDNFSSFSHNKDEFLRDFRLVNSDELDHAIAEATSALKLMAKLKKPDNSNRLPRP